MAIWSQWLSEMDKQVYMKAGYCQDMTLGTNLALLVIDMTYAFTGFKPEPVLQAIETFHTACGEKGWEAVAKIKPLISICRGKNIPVIYTVGHKRPNLAIPDPWDAKKRKRVNNISQAIKDKGKEIVEELKPDFSELVIAKEAPSAFFGTALIYYLQRLRVDTLFVVGTTTSGCIRSTVTDAFSYGYKIAVIEDGVFDRVEVSHAISLFDLNAKYCNLLTSENAIKYIEKLDKKV